MALNAKFDNWYKLYGLHPGLHYLWSSELVVIKGFFAQKFGRNWAEFSPHSCDRGDKNHPLTSVALSPLALRVFLWANPRQNDTSDLIAPVNRARESAHLSAFWANSTDGPLRKVQKTAKIAFFCHFPRPILTFNTPYSLLKHPKWPYLLEKGGRSAERLQTFGLKNLIFFPKMQ